jgi:anti-sigma regulatory factor (Ser/Thr protein kinase)
VVTRASVTAGARPNARGRGGWRPRRSIANLLRLLVAVPLLAVVGFAGLTLLGNVRQVVDAGDTQRLAALATDAGALARALQAERAAAAVALTTANKVGVDRFDVEVAQTNAALAAFRRHGTPTDAVRTTLRRVDTGLGNLENVRGQVRYSVAATLSSVSFSYRILIADLLALREAVAAGTSAQIVDDVRTSGALAQAGESIGQLQIVVLRSLAMGELTPAAQQEAAGATARLIEASTVFLGLAEPSWAAAWERVGANPQVITAQRLRDEVGRTVPGERFRVDASDWVAATNAWMTELYGVQRAVDMAVADQVARARAAELRSAVVQAAGVVSVLALTAALTSVVARRITRRLRWLQESVSTAAFQRLPVVVRELNVAPPGTVRHDEVADRSAAGLVLDDEDEIAEVSAAVRELFREAVRTAGAQAIMRANVADMFVHLSHREQRLVDALLAQVDRVEYDETDPDRLRQLYQLDNLATRMGRINQSLLVLGGSGTSRVRREPVPVVTVIQAALSQIEQYARVRIGTVEHRLLVAGDAIDEMAHLLAELLDNATVYSPPRTDVWVTSQQLPDRLMLQILDEGVGMSSQRREQINAQLAAPAAVELAGVRAMGLMVVGRLAARHGMRVELLLGQQGGTVAEVMVPSALLSWGDPAAPAPRLAATPAAVAPDGRAQPTSPPSPLFRPGGPVDKAVAHDRRTVNGWFKTASDVDAFVTWPTSDQQRWAATIEPAAASAASTPGLPRRLPQPHLVPDTPPARDNENDPNRRLDPATIASAMSAYARGVAGRRAPSP